MRPSAILRMEAPRGRALLKRFGVAGLLFFLVKGLFWLALPVVVVYLKRT